MDIFNNLILIPVNAPTLSYCTFTVLKYSQVITNP